MYALPYNVLQGGAVKALKRVFQWDEGESVTPSLASEQ